MSNDAAQSPAILDREEAASIIASSHDAIVGMARSGAITSCNPAASRLYGYTAREMIGQFVEALVPPEHRVEEAGILRRIMSGEEVAGYRTDRVRHDGTILRVATTISPILDRDGAVVGAATVSRRVSELEQAHDRFELRVDEHRVEADDTAERFEAQVVRARGKAQDAADRFEANVDLEREQVRGTADRFEVQVDLERGQVQDAADRFEAQVDVERGQVMDAADRFEVRVEQEREQARDATDRFEAQVHSERGHAEDATDRFEGLVDDERIQAGQAREQSEHRLESQRVISNNDREHLQNQLHQGQRLEVLGQLAGGVAHDFNNLLAVILNYAAFVAEELAAGQAPDLEAAGRDVGQIQRAAERATALTHQLLAFARREVVQPRVIDLNDIVTEVQQLLDRTIGTDVILHTDLAGGLWPILADAGQIEQILVNLAINARDAMSAGGTLTIDTANIVVGADFLTVGSPVAAGRHVRLRVSDTGTGMPADVVEHVFEPFFTTKPDGTGTGLGLATVYGIVRQAEGTIDIHSLLTVGTTFTIMIPVTDEVPVPVVEQPRIQRTPAGETLLIVEDEAALREVTERIFTRSGYHVLTAANGAEALDLAADYDGEIHLLITDVVMPNMLGKEVAKKILHIRPDIQVLYMSGYAQPVLASQGRLDSGVNLIEKPFSAAALIDKAGKILDGNFPGYQTRATHATTMPADTAPSAHTGPA